jgi:hypothetical protein
MNTELETAATEQPDDSASFATQPASITTRMTFATSTDKVWNGLLFYEEIDSQPPSYLRLLLPIPIRTEGKISEVGCEVMCLYEGGHLLKRITRIEAERFYEFEVAEQSISVGGSMLLCGGGYTLRELSDGATEVSVETRYISTKWPRWFWRPLEGIVCHCFHRYLLISMRHKIESR